MNSFYTYLGWSLFPAFEIVEGMKDGDEIIENAKINSAASDAKETKDNVSTVSVSDTESELEPLPRRKPRRSIGSTSDSDEGIGMEENNDNNNEQSEQEDAPNKSESDKSDSDKSDAEKSNETPILRSLFNPPTRAITGKMRRPRKNVPVRRMPTPIRRTSPRRTPTPIPEKRVFAVHAEQDSKGKGKTFKRIRPTPLSNVIRRNADYI